MADRAGSRWTMSTRRWRVVLPVRPAAEYSTLFDQPPEGTVPISRSTGVQREERVVAYIRGRWRDAVVFRKDVGTLFVQYSREGPFGQDLRTTVRVDWVRRRT